MSERARRQALVGALPFAAWLALVCARLVPIEFQYFPNGLGIVSRATLDEYPQHQETFWLFASLAIAVLGAWAWTRLAPSGRIEVEALAAGALLAALWLPGAVGLPLGLGCVGGAVFLARRNGPREAEAPPAPLRRRAGAPLLLGLALLLALALTPTFPVALWDVWHRVPDAERTADTFTFHGEMGQHLAWANSLLHGGFHGRDFFCLYGPLYDLGVVGLWKLVGRSISAWELYFSTQRVLGMLALMVLGMALVRRRSLALLAPLLVPWVHLRIGLPLFGLALLASWLARPTPAKALLAGLLGGTALLLSQEFGLAFCVTAALAFAIARAGGAALAFAVGAGAALAPVLGWYAAEGALGPMLRELVAYPGYLVAGYAKIPFPSLAAAVPLDPGALGGRELLAAQLGYGMPAICLGALLLALPLADFDPRHPLASTGRAWAALRVDPRRCSVLLVAVFGMLAFRSALGRSDLVHMIATLAPATVLVVVALDWLLDTWRRPPTRRLAVWRSAALALLVLHAGLLAAPTPLRNLQASALATWGLLREGHQPAGSRHVMRVTRWVQLHTEDGEPVLFLPNNAAYYYLTDRPNPIRFAMGHQIVTADHRAEVLEVLRAAPPRYVIWDHGALRVDGISDEQVFGRELLAWIGAHYREQTRIGEVSVLALREGSEADSR